LQAQNLEKALDALKGMKITLFLSENQLVEGILLNFKQDHIIFEVDKDVYYIALKHIKAISKNAKDYHIYSKVVPYLDSNYFTNILKEMKYNWVNVNSLSNRALIGVLTKISKDCIVLINEKEVTFVKKSNISSIYKVIKQEDTDQEVDENQEDQQEPIVDTPIVVTNEIEVDKKVDVTFTEQISEKVKEDGNLPVDGEVIIAEHYAALQLDEQVLPSENEELLLEVIMKQEVAVQEVEENHQEKPIVDKHIEVTHEKEMKKKVVVPFREQISGKVKEDGDLVVNEEVVISEYNDTLQMDKQSLRCENGDLEGNKGHTRKGQYIPNSSNDNQPPKQFLPNTFKRHKHGNKNQKKSVKVNQFLVHDRNTTEMKQRFSKHLMHKKKTTRNLGIEEKNTFIKEKPEPIKLITPEIPVRKLSPMEENEMLEQQYYSLMNHAARMYDHSQRTNKNKVGKVQTNVSSTNPNNELANKRHINVIQVYLQEETMIEKQYYALMKYTSKKYQQLREERKVKRS